MKEIKYDRQLAVNYARKWAKGRNPYYYDFSRIGGDCTNFASQCIFAGAGVMNFTPTFGWYYLSLEERTPSWTGVEFLYDFLVNNKSAGPYGREVLENEVMPGDIVQLGRSDGDFFHTPVISAVYPRILVCAHSNDVRDVPLESYSYNKIRFIHIDKVRGL